MQPLTLDESIEEVWSCFPRIFPHQWWIGRAGMKQTTAGIHCDVITRETWCITDKVSFSLASSPAVTSTGGDNTVTSAAHYHLFQVKHTKRGMNMVFFPRCNAVTQSTEILLLKTFLSRNATHTFGCFWIHVIIGKVSTSSSIIAVTFTIPLCLIRSFRLQGLLRISELFIPWDSYI